MAKLPGKFKASDHDDMSDFSLLPVGDYECCVVESEMKTTNKGDGEYLKLKFKILEGKYKDRFFWRNLNLDNPSRTAVEIAQKELATLTRACGIQDTPEDSDEFHSIPIIAKLNIKKGKGDNQDEQTVGKYLPTGAKKPNKPSSKDDGDEGKKGKKGKKDKDGKKKRKPVYED